VTELVIKAEPQILDKFKSLSQQLYQGDDATAFRDAVLALFSLQTKKDTTRLKSIIDKIRSDIEAGGGLASAQIDQMVRESRQRRKAAK